MPGRKAEIARLMGRRTWVDDGRCEVPLSTMVVNFWFQRVLRVNGACKFPVHFTSQVIAADRVHVGRGVARYLASSGGVYVQALNGVVIGDYVMIAPGVKIISANHVKGSATTWEAANQIEIGSHVWIGANAVILPGVSIGSRATIAAGAVVTRSVDAGSVVGGVPAATLRRSGESELST